MSAPLHNADAEASVIGAALIDNSVIPALAAIVRPEDFHIPANKAIWGAIASMARQGQGVDLVTLTDRLEAGEQLSDCGGLSYIASIQKNTPSTVNASFYAETVAELGRRRQMIISLPELEERIRDRAIPVDEVITNAQASFGMFRRENADDDFRPVGDFLSTELLDPLDRRFSGDEDVMGLPFGIGDVDRRTMGLKPGSLVILGGRPSMGKTAASLGPVECAVERGVPTLYESIEMPREQILNRLAARMGNIPLQAIKDPAKYMRDDFWPRLTRPVTMLKDAPLVVRHGPCTISRIRQNAEKMVEKFGSCGLIIVDYLGKVRAEGNYGSRSDKAIGEVTGGLKQLALEFNCPVLLLAQLNRQLEHRPNKRPVMSDLKDSSDIEQDADIIIFLYRDEVYVPDTNDKGIAEWITAKNRDGEVGVDRVSARLEHMRFDNLAVHGFGE